MRIKFPCAMSFDVLYVDDQTQEPMSANHVLDGEYEVEKLELEEERYGYSAFMVVGDQIDANHKDLIDGGVFEVPNPAFDVVRIGDG